MHLTGSLIIQAQMRPQLVVKPHRLLDGLAGLCFRLKTTSQSIFLLLENHLYAPSSREATTCGYGPGILTCTCRRSATQSWYRTFCLGLKSQAVACHCSAVQKCGQGRGALPSTIFLTPTRDTVVRSHHAGAATICRANGSVGFYSSGTDPVVL